MEDYNRIPDSTKTSKWGVTKWEDSWGIRWEIRWEIKWDKEWEINRIRLMINIIFEMINNFYFKAKILINEKFELTSNKIFFISLCLSINKFKKLLNFHKSWLSTVWTFSLYFKPSRYALLMEKMFSFTL